MNYIISLDEPISIEIDFGWLLTFCVFIVHGYFGAATPSYEQLISLDIPSLFLFFAPLISLMLIYKFMIKNKSEYCSQFVFAIKKSDILVYVSILVFLSLLSIDTLNLALTGDELLFAQTGMLME